jgi:hypothetical protein
MANKLFFFLLFCTTLLFSLPLFAENGLERHGGPSTQLDLCDMPPPDSGRITVTGYNFISLEWIPVWEGATHTLIALYQANDSSSWVPVDTFLNLAGSSFTFENFQFASDKYGFLLSTNCLNGEPGTEFSFINPDVGVILELTIGGVTPVNPVILPECTPEKIGSSGWLGFFISGTTGLNPPRNYFEVTWNGGYAVVKRVLYSPVVAGTQDFNYPKNPPNDVLHFYDGNPKSVSFKTFKVEGENSFTDIGWVRITHTTMGTDDYFTFCPVKDKFWNNNYIFKMAKASITGGGTEYSGTGDPKDFFSEPDDHSLGYQNSSKKIRVQNPFQNDLNIYFPSILNSNERGSISIWDINGKLVLEDSPDLESRNITLVTTFLPSGTYFLRVATDKIVETIKILKIE